MEGIEVGKQQSICFGSLVVLGIVIRRYVDGRNSNSVLLARARILDVLL